MGAYAPDVFFGPDVRSGFKAYPHGINGGKSLLEIIQRRVNVPPRKLAFDASDRFAVFDNDEIYLSFVRVAEIPQFRVQSFAVLPMPAPFKKMKSNQVFEPSALIQYRRPVRVLCADKLSISPQCEFAHE